MNSIIKKPQRNTKSNSNTDVARKTESLLSSVGSQIFWNFHGASWKTETLRSLAAACQLKIDIKEIPVTNGMHNAVSLWKSRSDKGTLIAKKVGRDTEVFTFGILEVEIDHNGKKAKGQQIDKVVYDSVNKSFLSKGQTQYAKSLCDSIEHRVTHYTGNEFRKWIIMEFLDSVHAIRMMGGAYFVDSQKDTELSNFEKFCTACGVTLHCLRLSADKKTKSSMATIAREPIHEKISKLSDKLEIMKKRSKVRADGREGAKKDLEEIRFLSNRLKKFLDANTQDIDKLLVKLDKELEEINNSQPTDPTTANRVLQTWRNAMKPEYALNNGKFKIPFTDFEALLLPKAAKDIFYWKPDQRLGIALAELGYIGKVSRTHLLLKPQQ